MPQDRITKVFVDGLRTLEHIELDIKGLAVLAGVNGSGKSSIVESCEILHRAASPRFMEEFVMIHGGFDSLKRFGASSMRFGVRIEGAGPPLEYTFSIEELLGLHVSEEHLKLFEGNSVIMVIDRQGRQASVLDEVSGPTTPRGFPGAGLLLTGFGFRYPHSAMKRVVTALGQIDVQIGFEVLPAWVARELGRPPNMRTSTVHKPADALKRLGGNLANVYETLRRDQRAWSQTMEYVRIGLGDDIEDVRPERVRAGEGMMLWLKYQSSEKEVPASSLSDGTLDYLAFVAYARLNSQHSLIVFDEPELHLHPALLMRVLDLLEAMAHDTSVLISTHSDRLLDGLSEPAASIVLCNLNATRATEIARIDPDALEKWLTKYRGFGELRAEGLEESTIAHSRRGRS
jgi:predicted ATPase